MPVLLWGILALVGGLVAIWVGVRRSLPAAEPLPKGVELPRTPLQRVAGWSLGIGLLLGAGAAGILAYHGPETTYENDNVRLAFTLLILATMVVLGGGIILIKREASRDSGLLDERDLAILDRAPAVQGVATLLTMVIWVIGLTERFHDAGAVPLFHLMLLAWSCLVVYLLGLPLGILLGYRRR